MKTLKIIAIVLSILIVNTINAQDKTELKEIKFKAKVNCNSCKVKIEKNMAFAKGVKSVYANVESKVVTITYKTDKTNASELQKELEKCGYGAEMITDKCCPKSESKKCCDKSKKNNRKCCPEKK